MVNKFNLESSPIVLIDGECNFCNRTLLFILKYDRNEKFYFGSQQSMTAQQLLKKYNYNDNLLSTIYLIQNGKVLTKSSAIIEIAKQLSGFPKYLIVFKIIPKPIRDFGYDLFSKYRFLFGRSKTICLLPTPKLLSRMLQDK